MSPSIANTDLNILKRSTTNSLPNVSYFYFHIYNLYLGQINNKHNKIKINNLNNFKPIIIKSINKIFKIMIPKINKFPGKCFISTSFLIAHIHPSQQICLNIPQINIIQNFGLQGTNPPPREISMNNPEI
jgi:hypothetical protein